MRTDAASRSIGAVCFTIILLRQQELASAGCPDFPQDSSINDRVRKAMKCVQPIEAAQKAAGHVFLSSDLATIPSWNTATSIANNELRAVPAANANTTGKMLHIGTTTCALAAMALSKSDNTPSATVHLRLDFERCTFGHATRASVLMNVGSQPDAIVPVSMVPFWRQISQVDTTTVPPFVKAKLKLTFTELELGNNTCAATLLHSYPQLDKKRCKLLCIAEVEKYASSIKAVTNSQLACRAYDFNNVTSTCNLYKGVKVTEISDNKGTGETNCYNLTASDADFKQKTTPPPTDEAVSLANSKLPKAGISLGRCDKCSGNMKTFGSPDKCFKSFHWITLQDANRSTIFVNVKQSEWATLLELIPSSPQARLLAGSQEFPSYVEVQRPAYAAETPMVAPPTTASPPTAPPCPAEEVPASMAMTWLLVALAVIAFLPFLLFESGKANSAALAPVTQFFRSKATAPAEPPPPTQTMQPATLVAPTETGESNRSLASQDPLLQH